MFRCLSDVCGLVFRVFPLRHLTVHRVPLAAASCESRSFQGGTGTRSTNEAKPHFSAYAQEKEITLNTDSQITSTRR